MKTKTRKQSDTKNKAVIFITSLLICFLAAFIGYLFTNQSVKSWYPYLNKPSFNPPSWIFSPVWTILYLIMAISLYLIRIKPHTRLVKAGLIFFYIQLVFNVLWSFAFFTLKSPFLGLVDIVLLWILILITIILFVKSSRLAGYLLIPYLAWVSFALVLNYEIWWRN